MNDINNKIIGFLTVFIGASLTGGGFFVKYIVDQINQIEQRIDQRMGRMESHMDIMTADIADMKPKVNALWEHFLAVNKKPL